ncbi:MAG: hypothetical protein JJT96_12375 [Opitutales bacterium]|nr:hypothetical protein [Opitutales bacterium]
MFATLVFGGEEVERCLRFGQLPASMQVVEALLFYSALGATLAMTGIIWMVQMVHYPQFLVIDPACWQAAHARHCRMMGFLVGPLMLAELIMAHALLLWPYPTPAAREGLLVALGLTYLCWGWTIWRALPLHRSLEQAKNAAFIEKLVRENWLRTAAWTAKSAVLLYLVLR